MVHKKSYIAITFLILNTLLVAGKLNYLFPKPGSEFLPVQTNIVFSFDNESQKEITPSQINILVKGNKSGKLSGKLIKSVDGSRFIFKNSVNFQTDELITASITYGDYSKEFSFTTSNHKNFDTSIYNKISDARLLDNHPLNSSSGDLGIRTINGVSVPSDFPAVNVSVLKTTAPGKIFLNNWGGKPYIMILENDGTPYFYQRVEDRARDFKLQPTGTLTRRYIGNLNCFVELDSNYQIIDTLKAAAGYGTDEHGIQLLPNGNYLVMGLDYQTVDMSDSVAGGNQSAMVVGNSVQELDRDGNLLFNWRSWDHFNITDAIHENLQGGFIDYVHMNAVAYDYDGNILVSSRHLSEVTKIDRSTGEIIWRFGGLHDQFLLTNDQYGISYQHDVRPVPGNPNRYTVMDNGNFHNPPFSRAFEFEVDTSNMTAEKVWEYRHSPDRYTWWMGNVQRLPNGNTLINYADATLPKAVEVTPAGEVVYEMDFVQNINCYRTFRFDWESVVKKPYLIVESFSDKVALIFNKFGDGNVKSYKIYGGTSPNPTEVLAETENTYFNFSDLPNNSYYYFRVTAVDSVGNESLYSNEQGANVKYLLPGENMLANGDFSAGDADWNFAAYGGAQASGEVVDGEYHVAITTGGPEVWSVQLTQPEIGLIQGTRYIFEFDAYSSAVRSLIGKVEKNGDPYTNYGKINPVVINQGKSNYKFEFEMEDPTDYNVRVVFNCGGSAEDIYIDNVKLYQVVVDDVTDETEQVPTNFALHNNYPNPFNPSTTISYDIPERSNVAIEVYNLLGEKVTTLINKTLNPGFYEQQFYSGNLSSGIYIYRITAFSLSSSSGFLNTKKMILIK